MDHLSISTDKEVVFLYNFDFIPPPSFFFEILFSQVRMIFLDMKGTRPEVKKIYTPRSEMDHLRIYTDKEVVLLHKFDFITPSFLF